jgi:hypothetical protein
MVERENRERKERELHNVVFLTLKFDGYNSSTILNITLHWSRSPGIFRVVLFVTQ